MFFNLVQKILIFSDECVSFRNLEKMAKYGDKDVLESLSKGSKYEKQNIFAVKFALRNWSNAVPAPKTTGCSQKNEVKARPTAKIIFFDNLDFCRCTKSD